MLSDWPLIAFSLGCAALATALIIPPGLLIAWVLAAFKWPGKSVVETVVALPLVMPPVATGLILLKLFSRHGPLGEVLYALNFPIVFTWRAVVIAAAVMAFPLFVRTVRIAMEEVPREQIESAQLLGARPCRIFWSVLLPLTTRGIIAGTLLGFARALGEFGATILLAGNIPGETTTLSLAIYNLVQIGDDDAANRLLLYLVGLAFCAVILGEWFLRKRTI